MGKVRELLECACVQIRKPPVVYACELRMALDADEPAHAAELSAKDKRIAELEAERDASRGMTRVHAQGVAVLEQRIRDLEAAVEALRGVDADLTAAHKTIDRQETELAKRKELPPLPGDIRVVVDTLRDSHITHDQAVKLTAFIDAAFPKPVPQWELDARSLEAVANTGVRFEEAGKTCRDIAARIREAHREAK